MRLPFKVPGKKELVAWVSSKLVRQFGPLLMEVRDKQLVEDMETLRLLVANLAQLSGGPGWVESTQAAVLDIAKQVKCLTEIAQAHQKMFEEVKRTEDMWRGGRALSKLH